MYVRIDTDIWHIIEYSEDDFRCFDTNTWESLNQFEIVWNFSLILFSEYRTSLFDKSGLITKKIHISKV
jgi:hypothetical protein